MLTVLPQDPSVVCPPSHWGTNRKILTPSLVTTHSTRWEFSAQTSIILCCEPLLCSTFKIECRGNLQIKKKDLAVKCIKNTKYLPCSHITWYANKNGLWEIIKIYFSFQSHFLICVPCCFMFQPQSGNGKKLSKSYEMPLFINGQVLVHCL
jgi:hypothetical protein